MRWGSDQHNTSARGGGRVYKNFGPNASLARGLNSVWMCWEGRWVHVCSPKILSPKGLSPHNIPGGQDPKPEWGPGPKV